MPNVKLTLSADRRVVREAKRLAKARKTSVSAMFSRLIAAMHASQIAGKEPLGPLTRQATGLIKLPSHDRVLADLVADALSDKYGEVK